MCKDASEMWQTDDATRKTNKRDQKVSERCILYSEKTTENKRAGRSRTDGGVCVEAGRIQ